MYIVRRKLNNSNLLFFYKLTFVLIALITFSKKYKNLYYVVLRVFSCAEIIRDMIKNNSANNKPTTITSLKARITTDFNPKF